MERTRVTRRPILMTDEGPDDSLMTRRALENNNGTNPFATVADGVKWLIHSHGKGAHSYTPQAYYFEDLVSGIKALQQDWLDTVEWPSETGNGYQ